MYTPGHFKETRPEVLHQLLRDRPLAALVTLGPDGLVASHLPLLFDPNTGPRGTLRGHIARANGQWRDFSRDVEALAIFSGPQHYVSPSWYPSRAAHGKVVPTWNYVVVHAYGRLAAIEDAAGLLAHLRELTRTHEGNLENPWRVEDAPPAFIQSLLGSIVGVEMEITRLEGKWKVSQNRDAADRQGASAALRRQGDPDAVLMAGLIDGLES